MQIAPAKELSLFVSTRIIIGAGIYQMAPNIAEDGYCWSGVHPLKTGVL